MESLVATAIKEESEELEDDWMGQMDAQLRYYLHVSGEELDRMSLKEWMRLWCHLKRIRDEEANAR